jgi:hypothetical protein
MGLFRHGVGDGGRFAGDGSSRGLLIGILIPSDAHVSPRLPIFSRFFEPISALPFHPRAI